MQRVTVPKEYSYEPIRETKSFTGYVGLKNLGSTCYMNSILQQFFLILPFRLGIISADDKIPINKNNDKDIDDNFLHQLQIMYAYLNFSDRKEFNPSKFVYSFKDLSGNPTNPCLQQDAQEFLGILFDRLEKALVNTKFKFLVQSIFGYKNSITLTCKSCNSKNTKLEDSYYLSLNVTQYQEFDESLKAYLHEEIISGYQCDKCQKKSNVSKKTGIHSLPNILVVHLQRIIFDLSKGENVKVHSKFKFPTILNLLSFRNLEEGINDDTIEGNEYKLVGVLIHIGSAIGGHYTSIINTTRRDFTDISKFKSNDQDKWLEFNDSSVHNFNTQFFESECYGGSTEYSDDHIAHGEQQSSSKCAYMLLYEKFKKTDLKIIEIENGKNENTIINVPFYQLQNEINANLKEEVIKDNNEVVILSQVFSIPFFTFLNEIIKKSISAIETSNNQNITKFTSYLADLTLKSFFSIIIKVREENIKYAEDFSVYISTFISYKFINCEELLETLTANNGAKLIDIFFRCPHSKIRITVRDTIKKILQISNSSNYIKLAELLINWIGDECSQNWTKFLQFFETLEFILNEGSKPVIDLFVEKDVLFILLDFFLGRLSPFYNPKSRRNEMGNNVTSPEFGPLLRMVNILSEQRISSKADMCFNSVEFVSRILRYGILNESSSKKIGLKCNMDRKFGKKICRIIVRNTNNYEEKILKDYSLLARAILNIKSDNSLNFCEWLLGFPDKATFQQGNSFIRNPSKLIEEDIRYISKVINSESNNNLSNSSTNYTNSNYQPSYFGASQFSSYESSLCPILQVMWNLRLRCELASLIWTSVVLDAMKANSIVYEYMIKMIPISKNYLSIKEMILDIMDCNESEIKILSMHNMISKEKEEYLAHNQSLTIELFNISENMQINLKSLTFCRHQEKMSELKMGCKIKSFTLSEQAEISFYELEKKTDETEMKTYKIHRSSNFPNGNDSTGNKNGITIINKGEEEIDHPVSESATLHKSNETDQYNEDVGSYKTIKEEKEEEKKENNVKHLSTIMKVIAKNLTKDKIKIKFKIIPSNPQAELNFINSSLKMKAILHSMQGEYLITHLFKIKEEMDWGDFLIVPEVIVIEKNIPSSDVGKEEVKKETANQNPCPKCTYNNHLISTVCEICGALLIQTNTNNLVYPEESYENLSNNTDNFKPVHQSGVSNAEIARKVSHILSQNNRI